MEQRRFSMGAALRFPFKGQYVWPNIGCMLVCTLIPIVGPIVVQGYECGAKKLLIADIDADAPKFRFDKFSAYLKLGVAPFVASLIATLALLPLAAIMFAGIFGGMFLLKEHHEVAGIAVFVGTFFVYMIGVVAMLPLLLPVMFKASVEQTIGGAFDREFVFGFVRRVGLLTLGVQFLLMVMILPASVIMCIPFVGYALVVVVMQVQTHVQTQLYLIHVDRGGKALAFMPESPDAAFPVVMDAAVSPPGSVPPDGPFAQ